MILANVSTISCTTFEVTIKHSNESFLIQQTDAENIRSFVGGLEILVNLLKSDNLEVGVNVRCLSDV